MFIYDWTMILLLPALLLSVYAQAKVSSTYRKYAKVRAGSGYAACAPNAGYERPARGADRTGTRQPDGSL